MHIIFYRNVSLYLVKYLAFTQKALQVSLYIFINFVSHLQKCKYIYIYIYQK